MWIYENVLTPVFHDAMLTLALQKLLMSGRLPDDITIALRDPNVLAPLLPLVEHRAEALNPSA